MIYDNILGTIGRTPIVRINRLAPAGTTMYVKCEFFNPLSSVKDRLAIAIIEDAERTGALKPGQTVVEATSGNTGIALAMVCAAKGYPFVAKRLDHFVSGWGTGGTITGAGQVIKLARPDVKIIATEPEAAQLLGGKPFSPHKIQGWTPDFLPAVLDRSVPDRIVPVTDAEAIESARALAKTEGIFCGISSGATFAAALKVAADAPAGSVILAMLPDTAER